MNDSLLAGLAAMLWPEVAGDTDGAEEDLTAATPPGVLPNAIALQRARAGNAASAVSAGAAAECGETKPTVATPAVPKVTMPSFKLDLSAVRALPPPVLDTSPSDDEDDRTQDGRTDDGGLAPKEGEEGLSSIAGLSMRWVGICATESPSSRRAAPTIRDHSPSEAHRRTSTNCSSPSARRRSEMGTAVSAGDPGAGCWRRRA